MKIFKLLTTITAFFCVVILLTACSHLKASGNKHNSTQVMGIGDDQDGFAEEGSTNRLKAPYNQTYHFDFDKYVVKQEDIASINAQGNYLMTHSGAKVRIEGNADDRGSREYNVALGWKRAKAVAAILKQKGASDTQIAMVSYGKEKPVAFGHDEASYSKNRRADLVYESK